MARRSPPSPFARCAGATAASINCGYTTEGKPIGLQIAGRRFDDLGVMRLARWYEQARDSQKPWPQP